MCVAGRQPPLLFLWRINDVTWPKHIFALIADSTEFWEGCRCCCHDNTWSGNVSCAIPEPGSLLTMMQFNSLPIIKCKCVTFFLLEKRKQQFTQIQLRSSSEGDLIQKKLWAASVRKWSTKINNQPHGQLDKLAIVKELKRAEPWNVGFRIFYSGFYFFFIGGAVYDLFYFLIWRVLSWWRAIF